MNALMIAEKTMSSREIAELTVKEHKNVKRDCEAMFSELKLDALSFERIYLDTMNRQQAEYQLPFELVQTLITGYSIKLRHAVIQRLNELEASQKSFDPMKALSDPATMRGLLLTYSEKVLALEAQNEAMKPEVEAYGRIAKSDGSFCLMDTAKTLQVRPKDLMSWLQANGWIYKRAGCKNWIGYQEKIQAGYLEHKVNTVQREDGTEKVVEQVRVTAKGVVRLAVKMRSAA